MHEYGSKRLQRDAELGPVRHRHIQPAAGLHIEPCRDESHGAAGRSGERCLDIPGAGRFLGNDCAGVFGQRPFSHAHLRDFARIRHSRQHCDSHRECVGSGGRTDCAIVRAGSQTLRYMASARTARLCPCDGLRQEAAEILGAVPFDVGRHDATSSMRWGQQRHQGSTSAELYGYGYGDVGCDSTFHTDHGHSAMTRPLQ